MPRTSHGTQQPERAATSIADASAHSAHGASDGHSADRAGTAAHDELTESELEVVVGGLARTIGELPSPSQTAWRLI